jgi:hypothetical protein
MTDHDEFYIGYEPEVPPGIAKTLWRTVVTAVVFMSSIAAAVTLAQRPLAHASFDYGHHQSWIGWLERTPAPALVILHASGEQRLWLVGRGKHGAAGALDGVAEGWVRVTGTQITRHPWRMVEIASAVAAPPPPGVSPRRLGGATPARQVALHGEIVDSKCFLGVMNPGERVVHRDCAIRCLSGGVPPMLSFEGEAGGSDLAVLVDEYGGMLHDRVHSYVGRRVRVEGRLSNVDGQSVLQVLSIQGATR